MGPHNNFFQKKNHVFLIICHLIISPPDISGSKAVCESLNVPAAIQSVFVEKNIFNDLYISNDLHTSKSISQFSTMGWSLKASVKKTTKKSLLF